MKNYLEFRIYVGTYGKYNSGSLFGKWLDLSDYTDLKEFYQACYDLHKDEHDPELMFQDYENIPEFLIWESGLDKEIYPYMEAVAEMDQNRAEALRIYCGSVIGWAQQEQNFEELLTNFDDCYQGYFGGAMKDAQEEFAYYLIEETGLLSDVAGPLARYFDYKSYGNDLFLDGYTEYDGHVFYDGR